ncbi:MAG TPA: hypothetical protein VH877_18975 [Polyangia bacterium]|jgi:hypothetical protein|nr:hypothetical protein [Polyangia bacterium]
MRQLHPARGTVALGLVAFGLLLGAGRHAKALPPTNALVILNTGTTDTIGYRIVIPPSGEAFFVTGKGPGQKQLPAKLLKKLHKDLAAVGSLEQMAVRTPCPKPAASATTTTLQYHGQFSGDLTCAGDKRAVKLQKVITEVVKVLGVTNVPRSEGQELPPQRF